MAVEMATAVALSMGAAVSAVYLLRSFHACLYIHFTVGLGAS